MKNLIVSFFFLSLIPVAYGQPVSAYSENNPLLGSWKFSKIIIDVQTNDTEATRIIKEEILSAPNGTLTFNNDGTGVSIAVIKEMDDSLETSFTYDLTDTLLTIYTEIVPGETDAQQYQYSRENKLLTLISDDTDKYDPDTLEDLEVPNPDNVVIKKVVSTQKYTRL